MEKDRHGGREKGREIVGVCVCVCVCVCMCVLLFGSFSAIGFGASSVIADTAYHQFGVNESWRWAFRVCIS